VFSIWFSVFKFLARPRKKESAPHSSRTLLRGGNPIPPNFKKLSLGFANPPSRKIVSQNRVHICISAHHILLKTLWWCAERFPALLLQQKLCASHRGAQAERGTLVDILTNF
jgi:hypothetical protein